MDQRQQNLHTWLSGVLQTSKINLQILMGDASFRRYFRLQHAGKNYIVVDTSCDDVPCTSFIQIAETFEKLGLRVPTIFKADVKKGFMLISDLGNRLYFNELKPNNADQLYNNAIDKLLIIQAHPIQKVPALKAFDYQCMQVELHHFTDWFLEKYLSLSLDTKWQKILNETYEVLLQQAAQQPQVYIHRDYHSRNLTVLPNNEVGILDFQDAMLGPITYDLVSLLRDCYVDWPQEKVKQWTQLYYQKASGQQLLENISEEKFLQYFDFMGIQRHLKAIFIFARKFLRDADESYLQYIPRTLNYVIMVCEKYSDLSEFKKLLTQRVLPPFNKKMSDQK